MAKSDTIDLLFSFDTTGSMYPCLTQVRRYVKETTKYLFDQIPNIRIGILTHGDYCDEPKVITSLDFSDDPKQVCRFIESAPSTYGGDEDECYELVLNQARKFSWTKGRNKAMILIADASPHKVGYRYEGLVNELDWENEAGLLIEAGITIYPVQALGYRSNSRFYDRLAEISGVEKLELPQFSDISDIIIAICMQRASKLTQFEETLQHRHKPASYHVMANIDRLAGRKVRSRPKKGYADEALSGYVPKSSAMKDLPAGAKRLKAVHPSRFQILDIGEEDRSIKDFVADNGLEFKTGRGFYEFTKPETIQAYKQVVVEDTATGKLYSGDKARVIAGIPLHPDRDVTKKRGGPKDKCTPKPTEFTVFVQSTSPNRRLKANTRFLYEVEELVPKDEVEPELAMA